MFPEDGEQWTLPVNSMDIATTDQRGQACGTVEEVAVRTLECIASNFERLLNVVRPSTYCQCLVCKLVRWLLLPCHELI